MSTCVNEFLQKLEVFGNGRQHTKPCLGPGFTKLIIIHFYLDNIFLSLVVVILPKIVYNMQMMNPKVNFR